MKTSCRAWKVYQLRLWVGLAGLLLLAVVQFGLVFRFDPAGVPGPATPGPVSETHSLGDWLASR